MRAGEMSMAERIVRKIRREPFIDEENDLFCERNVIEQAVADSITAFYSRLILDNHFFYVHIDNACPINAKRSLY